MTAQWYRKIGEWQGWRKLGEDVKEGLVLQRREEKVNELHHPFIMPVVITALRILMITSLF